MMKWCCRPGRGARAGPAADRSEHPGRKVQIRNEKGGKVSVEMHYNVEVVRGVSNELGESPVWSVEEQALYWVDIRQGHIHRWTPVTDDRQSWTLPGPVASVGLRRQGGLVVAMGTGFYLFEIASGTLRLLHDVEPGCSDRRLNDGKVSPEGRFWAGTQIGRTEQAALAALYRLDADHCGQRVLTQLKVCNGLAWSPDGTRLYHSDSRDSAIWRYDYDTQTGGLENRTLFATVPPEWGRPDGAAMDIDGCYWSAGVSRGRINRFSPQGELIGFIRLPVTHPTMPCFGGPDLKTLYVTSLRAGLGKEQLRQSPLAGALLKIELDIQGMTTGLYSG